MNKKGKMLSYQHFMLNLLSLTGIVGLTSYGVSAWAKPQSEPTKKPHVVLILADDVIRPTYLYVSGIADSGFGFNIPGLACFQGQMTIERCKGVELSFLHVYCEVTESESRVSLALPYQVQDHSKGWNDVSFHGADQIPTPNIDALAYNGVILNRHYVLPIGTPSRTSLLTGRYAIREGMQGSPLQAGELRGIPPNLTLMPEYLQRLGYDTHFVGKWHLGSYTKDPTPLNQDFGTFFGYYNVLISYFSKKFYQSSDDERKTVGKDFLHDGPYGSHSEPIDPRHFTDLITDEAEKIIKNNGNEKPMFLEIAHLAVHTSDIGPDILEVRNQSQVDKDFYYIEDNDRRKYAGMMTAMDESVGRVVKALSEAQMLENSIIIFMADNGAPTVNMFANTGSNYPLRGIKDTLFEGAIRGVACIFSPRIKYSSRVSEEFMHITDWMPTLYSAAGGKIEDLGEIDGVDQWETLKNGKLSPRRNMLVNIDEQRNWESAIMNGYKLIKGYDGEGQDYYGETGNDLTFPPYDAEDALLTSMAGQAIKNLPNSIKPLPALAEYLRQKSIVRCKNFKNYPNCAVTCLFNIIKDPCETQDLSKRLPEVVKSLESYIDGYRKVLMPQKQINQNSFIDRVVTSFSVFSLLVNALTKEL